jgi:hypothetical protein
VVIVAIAGKDRTSVGDIHSRVAVHHSSVANFRLVFEFFGYNDEFQGTDICGLHKLCISPHQVYAQYE